ncbi:MAG: hypothetical protein KA479_01200 [Saprospiraceae bacterium]|nr:hypothetical protein [Saprospiraceae bacterium]
MKKFALFLLLLAGLTGSITAQEESDRAYKKAKRALGAYNLDPGANTEKLQEAWDMIGVALDDVTIQQDPEAWITKGQIALEAANRDITAIMLNPKAQPNYPSAALDGFNAFKQGLSLSKKGYNKKDALQGIYDIVGALNNMAIVGYQTDKLDVAHAGFSSVIEAHDILTREKEKSALDDKAYQDAMFSAAATCGNASDKVRCMGYLEKLRVSNYPNAYIYDLLYNGSIETDKAKAVSYLEEGRKKYPDEVSLLFTEINHYLREGKLDELVGKLKAAIEKEPENKSLYLTLGNVYDNLFQKAMEAKETEKAGQHFDAALSYYQQALSKDENYLDATYSIGALYYNRAAVYTQSLNVLADDYSKEGLKKYDAMKQKVEAEFTNALPYFQRAEQLDPNDLNTLVALKEIYARKNDLAVSNEFKKRLEHVQAGNKNSTSYFKK